LVNNGLLFSWLLPMAINTLRLITESDAPDRRVLLIFSHSEYINPRASADPVQAEHCNARLAALCLTEAVRRFRRFGLAW
jgi:hypothetical protein